LHKRPLGRGFLGLTLGSTVVGPSRKSESNGQKLSF
jgi:hypothetical protein